jgi:hypothetical protein
MINQGNNVPDNTIAFFSAEEENLDTLKKPEAKRDWFDKWFYNCLPLTIGNQYGFILTCKQSFNVVWNGGNAREDIHITFIGDPDTDNGYEVKSHFGSGILTIMVPFVLRTPPGINLMTISPPNYITDNVTHMTGVVESDNIRMSFTFNLKIQRPNIVTHFAEGQPLAAFIPIPRYFADSFEIKNGKDLFSKDLYNEEIQAFTDHLKQRKSNSLEVENNLKDSRSVLEKDYLYGKDIYGNKFLDHQSAIKKKNTTQE